VIGDDYQLYGKTPMEKKAEENAKKVGIDDLPEADSTTCDSEDDA
jgi:hypothetical protein